MVKPGGGPIGEGEPPAMTGSWKQAMGALRSGQVVLIPTDTVYGLAVVPTHPGATQRLFDLKGRRRDVPIAVLAADASQAFGIALQPVPPSALELADRYWPGGLTIVVERDPSWPGDVGDGSSIGLRCPDHPEVRRLCRAVGPLATSSANVHGRPTPPDATTVSAVFETLGAVVDGGALAGLASTVVDCRVDPPQILRQGAVTLR